MIELTPEILNRSRSKYLGLYDLCVICGLYFPDCDHSVAETEDVIKRARAHDKQAKARLKRDQA